jgi:hypothetical protein
MATYNDAVISIQATSISSDGVLYTCPAGKFAKVSVRLGITTGSAKITVSSGATLIDQNERTAFVYLAAGQTLNLTSSGATGLQSSATAFEYSAP